MTSHTALSVRTSFVIAAAFAATASIPATAFAQTHIDDREIRSVTVRYADLNLATEEGSRQLYDRLVVAAHQVCPEEAQTLMALRQNLEAQRCIEQAVDRAVKNVRNPKFAEVASRETAGSHLR
jgi:UrcA family protein